MIPFNKPFLIGSEIQYIEDAVRSGKISGNGKYTKMCQQFFEQVYGFKKTLLTSSCTDALEMAAILANIKEGDEVIVPANTYIASVLSISNCKLKPVLVDPDIHSFNIDPEKIFEQNFHFRKLPQVYFVYRYLSMKFHFFHIYST